MASDTKVYIAGVGYSPDDASGPESVVSLVSAATKTLLDAGVTFEDVTHGVTCKTLSSGSIAFKAFGEREVNIDRVAAGSELDASIRLVRDRDAQCVLMVAAEKSCAVAVVAVSEDFIWRHPYLKDSSALVRESHVPHSKPGASSEGLHDICKIVWALRGWTQGQEAAMSRGSLYHRTDSSQGHELSRADEKGVPKWQEVEHKQDGKHRLGYNPATETREVSQEDFDAVRAGPSQSGRKERWDSFKHKGGDRAALARL